MSEVNVSRGKSPVQEQFLSPNLCMDDVIIMQIVIDHKYTSDSLFQTKGLLFSSICVNIVLFSTNRMSHDLTEMPGMSHDVREECYMTVVTCWQVCQ